MGFSEHVCVRQGMWLCEEQQRRSSVVLIRRLQRCGLGTRCQDVPGETALTPSRPAKRGHSLSQNASVTVTVGNGGATEHLRKQSFLPHCRYGNAPIFLLVVVGGPGRQNRPGRCLSGRHLCSRLWRAAKWYVTFDILHADASHPQKNVVKEEGREKLGEGNNLFADVCIVYTAAPAWKVTVSVVLHVPLFNWAARRRRKRHRYTGFIFSVGL